MVLTFLLRYVNATGEQSLVHARFVSLVHAGFLSLVHSRSLYAWDSQQLAGSKVVLSRDHVVQKKKLLLKLRSCR